MKLDDLFNIFFEKDNKRMAYSNEYEYLRDRYRLLDLFLYIACAQRFIAEDENPLVELYTEYFENFPFTIVDIESALQSFCSRDNTSDKHIYNLLSKAIRYINERKLVTENSNAYRTTNIIEGFKLSAFEEFALYIALAPYFDKKYENIFAFINYNENRILPTRRLAIDLYRLYDDISAKDYGSFISDDSDFFTYIVDNQVPDKRFSNLDNSFIACKRIYAYCMGDDKCETYLDRCITVFKGKDIDSDLFRPIIREDYRDKLLNIFCHYDREDSKSLDGTHVVHIYGQNGLGKRFLIKSVASVEHRDVIFIDLGQIAYLNNDDCVTIIKKIYVETVLLHAIPCFYVDENPNEIKEDKTCEIPEYIDLTLREISNAFTFAMWICEEKAEYLKKYSLHFTNIELPILSINERIVLWEEFSKEYNVSDEVDLTLCANQYVLTSKDIKEVLETADMIRVSETNEAINKIHIVKAVKQQAANQLGRYATLVESVYTWDNLVIDDEQRRHMMMICNQLKYRNIVGENWGFHKKNPYGRGICALFYGSPGTGKTMAVQVIANELGLDLYRIDLSQLVSKYIGETEKNITNLFRRAKNINALLFFDEADSLFAKRTEVKDSKDRNANAETSHLLQKLEDYDGITILATNYANNIDDAFKRRIKFMVNFVFPNADVRLDLWKTIIPKEACVDEELDFEFYANHFELSGSNIKEILNNAAFIAASEGCGICNRHIVESIKINYAKYGKLLTKDDFEYLG